jgi:hypothetical protein
MTASTGADRIAWDYPTHDCGHDWHMACRARLAAPLGPARSSTPSIHHNSCIQDLTDEELLALAGAADRRNAAGYRTRTVASLLGESAV